MIAVAITVAALLLGHDISKAIDRLTDAIERNKQETKNDPDTTTRGTAPDGVD